MENIINELKLENKAILSTRAELEESMENITNELKLKSKATFSAKSKLESKVSSLRHKSIEKSQGANDAREVGIPDDQDPLIEGMVRKFNFVYLYVDVAKICKRIKVKVERVYDLLNKG